MDTSLATAITSASGGIIVSVVSVVWIGRSIDRLDRQMAVMAADLKEFYKELARHDREIALLQQGPRGPDGH